MKLTKGRELQIWPLSAHLGQSHECREGRTQVLGQHKASYHPFGVTLLVTAQVGGARPLSPWRWETEYSE